VFDRFASMLRDAVAGMKTGDPLEPGIEQGPLINRAALEKVQSLVGDALARGAKVEVGGTMHELGGLYFHPTVLTGITPQMRMCHEEIFGPVAPLQRFEHESEVIAQANDTP
jgi:succinate-semialdehyde dehydrogenase/glutarate-semialdehyde dehydrogenase